MFQLRAVNVYRILDHLNEQSHDYKRAKVFTENRQCHDKLAKHFPESYVSYTSSLACKVVLATGSA